VNPRAENGGDEIVAVAERRRHRGERRPIWEKQKKAAPGFADYETKMTGQIPVVILQRSTA
jgi:hypothetical protein